MRAQLDQQLNILNVKMLELATLVESSVANSVKALIDKDLQLAASVVKDDVQINEKEREIEQICLSVLLQQQPVARDFRTVTSTLKIITDMERIGDHAVNIADITINLGKADHIIELVKIPQMAKLVKEMITTSIDAYVERSLDKAHKVVEQDDLVDKLFISAKKDLIDLVHADKANGEQALEFMMIIRYLERIGDHTTNIAEWVEFAITGIHTPEGVQD